MIRNCGNCQKMYECKSNVYVCDQWADRKVRPLVYIASALKGNLDQDIKDVPVEERHAFIQAYLEKNLYAAALYTKEALESNVIPITPHLYFSSFLDDTVPQERKLGMDVGISWLLKSEAIWVYTSIIGGIINEINKAIDADIPVFNINTRERITEHV